MPAKRRREMTSDVAAEMGQLANEYPALPTTSDSTVDNNNSSSSFVMDPSHVHQQRGPAVKQGVPENDDLERLASELTEVWEKLGRRLGIKEAQLAAFHKQYENYSEKAYKMLSHWKQKNGRAATYQVLYDALCDSLVSHKNLAEEYCCDR